MGYEKLLVSADNNEIELDKSARSLAVSNINSFGGGRAFLWGKDATDDKEQKWRLATHGDRHLELMSSSRKWIEPIKVMTGLGHYQRLAQPKEISIELTEGARIQVDGEAWDQTEPGVIQISHKGQVLCSVGEGKAIGLT